jgi:Cu/Ag efflux protein CusF
MGLGASTKGIDIMVSGKDYDCNHLDKFVKGKGNHYISSLLKGIDLNTSSATVVHNNITNIEPSKIFTLDLA